MKISCVTSVDTTLSSLRSLTLQSSYIAVVGQNGNQLAAQNVFYVNIT